MNSEVLYKARRTLLSQRFIGAVGVAVVTLAGAIAVAVITKSFGLISQIFLILFGIAVIVALIEGLSRRACTVEFYKDRYVIKSGLISKKENTMRFNKILAVNVDISFLGGIFNYGNVHLDCVGKNDAQLGGVKNPKALKAFLEETMMNTNYDDVREVISE